MTQEIRKIEIDTPLFIEQICSILQQGEEKSVTFTVRGYSMRPFIEHNRDKVVLVPPRPPKIGEVVLAEITPKIYALHRIIAIKGDTIILQGDGNSIKNCETTSADRIIGTAKAFIRKGRYISTDSRVWRLYSTFWQRATFLRSTLLTMYRIKKHIL